MTAKKEEAEGTEKEAKDKHEKEWEGNTCCSCNDIVHL